MTPHSPSEENTCAIIVTYRPDSAFPVRLAETRRQFPYVVIVDNGSDQAQISMLSGLVEDDKVRFISNPRNLGVASALNQGIKLVSDKNFEWIVTFDQDTKIFPDMLKTLVQVFENCGINRILIGANYWNVNKQSNFLTCNSKSRHFQQRKTLITSGTLISLNTFRDIGLFREDYFIDSVDHEFCLRARSNGYRILISCKPGMSQTIGNDRREVGWFRRHISFDHSPTRKYYIARNSVVTINSYFSREPVWSMFQILRLIADIGAILFFDSEKSKKLGAFARGVYHGATGKMGPIETTCPNGF